MCLFSLQLLESELRLQVDMAAIVAEDCGDQGEEEEGCLEDEGVEGAELSQEDMAELEAELAGLEAEEEGDAATALGQVVGDREGEGTTAAPS